MENLNNSIKIFSLTNDIYTLIDIKTIYRKLASENRVEIRTWGRYAHNTEAKK